MVEILYSGFDGNDYEIYRYNIYGKTYQYTNNQTDDFNPKYGVGNNLTYNYPFEYFSWVNKTADSLELLLAISDSIFHISKNIVNETSTRALFFQLSWLGDDGDREIYNFDIDANIEPYLEVSDTVINLNNENEIFKIGIKSNGAWSYSSKRTVVNSDSNNLHDTLEISQYGVFPNTDTLKISLGTLKTKNIVINYDPSIGKNQTNEYFENKINFNYQQQNITIQDIDTKMQIELMDIYGRILSSGTTDAANTTTIPMTNYLNGVYIVTLHNQNIKYSKKIIK